MDDTPADRIRSVLDLTALGEKLLRQRLCRTHPGLSEDALDDAVARWFASRPGAQFGDAPGPVSDRTL